MKLKIILLFIFLPIITRGQDSFLIGNAQINSMIDESDLPEGIEFHFSTRLSFGFQFPLFFDSTKQIERASIELAVGTLFNSIYYKYALRDDPKRDLNTNTVSGLFIKVEPEFKLWQNKQENLCLHASLNNIVYLFESISESNYTNKDSSDIILRTEYTKNQLQYSPEPYLGISYKLNDFLFRMKFGYAFHYLPVARMGFLDSNKVSSIKFNNFSWLCSVGIKLSSNK